MLFRYCLFIIVYVSGLFAQAQSGSSSVSQTGSSGSGSSLQSCIDKRVSALSTAQISNPVTLATLIVVFVASCKAEEIAKASSAAATKAEIQSCVDTMLEPVKNRPAAQIVPLIVSYIHICKTQIEQRKRAAAVSGTTITTSVSSSSTPFGGVQSGAVIGGCGTPEQCAAYMAEAAKPKYTWGIPVPFLNGPMDVYNHTSANGTQYEMPAAACNASNQGQIIAMDFGEGTNTDIRAVACMGPGATMQDMIEKIKATDIKSLKPVYIAVKKPRYGWDPNPDHKPVVAEGQVVICNGPPICNKDNVGEKFNPGTYCQQLICARQDKGGPVKEEKSSAAFGGSPTVPNPSPAPAPSPHWDSGDPNPAPSPSGWDPNNPNSGPADKY